MNPRAVRLSAMTILVTGLLAGAPAAMAAETLIVALGASSTAGKGVASDETYPAQLEAMLDARGYEVRIVNAGINGDTSSGLRARLDRDVPAGTGLVILQAGTNDAGDGGHDANIAAIVDRLRARSIKVLLLRTRWLRALRADHAQADGHHLTAEGYRILAARFLPMVVRDLRR